MKLHVDDSYIAITNRYEFSSYYDEFSQSSQFEVIKSDAFKRKSIKARRKKRYVRHTKDLTYDTLIEEINSDSEKNEIQNIKHEMNNSSQRVSKQQQNIHQVTDIDESDNERDRNTDKKKENVDENLDEVI